MLPDPLARLASMENSQDGFEAETRVSRPGRSDVAGRYRLDRFLAAGGCGSVYEGHYTILEQKKKVAIKLLKVSANAGEAGAIRFREEVKTLCLLDHPNVCKVIDGGIEDDGTMFLVMDFAEGGSLKARLEAAPSGRIPAKQALVWMIDAARGLLAAECHRGKDNQPLPIYHRDIKPANLLLQQNRVVVADFGAAKLGGDNPGVTSNLVPALWTPEYGSPEQQIGVVDHRSDIYSLGATFYQLLTGQLTQDRFKNSDDRFKVAHDPSKTCRAVPKALGAVVRRMTEPSPDKRYPSFADLLTELESLHRPAVVTWGLRLAVGALGLGLVAVGLQLTGVIGAGTAFARDEAAPTFREVRERCESLQAQVELLGRTDWRLLSGLRARVDGLAKAVAGNAAVVAKMNEYGIGGDERRRLPDTFTPLVELEPGLRRLTTLVPEHVVVRDEIDRAAQLVDKSSTASVRQVLLAARSRLLQLEDSEELRKSVGALEQTLDEVASQRRSRLQDLQQRLARGELEGLAELARTESAAFRQLGEVDLARSAEEVAGGADLARELAGKVPRWPLDPRAPLAELPALFDALRQLSELGPTVAPQELRQYWGAFAKSARDRWLQALADAFQREAKAWADAAVAFNKRVEAESKSLAGAAGLAEESERLQLERRRLETLIQTIEELPLGEKEVIPLRLPPATLSQLPIDLPVDLAEFDQLLAEAVPPPSVAKELEDAVSELTTRRDELRARVEDARSRKLAAGEGVQLYSMAERLRQARRLFAVAGDTLQKLTQVRADLRQDASSCKELMERCRADEATVRFAALESLRAVIEGLVRDADRKRREEVRSLLARFESGDADVAAIDRDARSVGDRMEGRRESELATQCRDLVASAQRALKFQEALPKWICRPELGRNCSDLNLLPQALADLAKAEIGAEDRHAAAWWQSRRLALAKSWGNLAEARWAELRKSLVAAVDAVASGTTRSAESTLAGELAAAEALRGRLVEASSAYAGGLFGVALAMELPKAPSSDRSAAPLPEGWPNPQFAPPAGIRSLALSSKSAECLRLYEPKFLADAEARGLRLWFFPARSSVVKPDGSPDGPPVYMAWCQSRDGQAAILVDVHPVTFGALPDALRVNQYDGPEFTRSPATMVYETSRRFCLSYASYVSTLVSGSLGTNENVRFSLPPDDYRSWVGCDPYGSVPEWQPREDFYPEVALPFTDLCQGGIGFLRSGLREWTATAAIGRSQIPPNKREAPRQRDTGFRLALVLEKR